MEAPIRLVAVDDSATIRKAFELILVPAGYAVEFATTGAEGLAKTRQSQPAVVLLDFILPDMRGSDVARELLAEPRTARIPVVLISTKGAEIRQAYRDIANVVAYITKPFTPDQVLNAVTEVLARGTDGGFSKTMPVEPLPAPPPSTRVETGESYAAEAATGDVPSLAASDGVELASAALDLAPARDELWSHADGSLPEDEEDAAVTTPRGPAARPSLERMFETLLSGLEGVYVEEVDTPTGAVADQAKSYTDLASQLTRQLVETLEHARSGARFGLCSDGSVQSLADMLLDTHRRVCRLLFRAVAAGAVEAETAGRSRARVLVVRHPDSEPIEQWLQPNGEGDGWQLFTVTSDFRQLPVTMRLYGPTHVVVEAAPHAALWDQLRRALALPEGRRLKLLGVRSPRASVDAATLATVGICTVADSGPGLREFLCGPAGDAARPVGDPREFVPAEPISAAALA